MLKRLPAPATCHLAACVLARTCLSPACVPVMQHASIYAALLWLTDFSSLPSVRATATRLLDFLPTYQQVLQDLTEALQGPQPGADMQKLLLMPLADELVPGCPGRLLYTLQASTPFAGHIHWHSFVGTHSV